MVITGSLTDGTKHFAVAIATTKLTTTIEVIERKCSDFRQTAYHSAFKVKKGTSETLHVYTVVKYSVLDKLNRYSAVKENLEAEALQVLISVLLMVRSTN